MKNRMNLNLLLLVVLLLCQEFVLSVADDSECNVELEASKATIASLEQLKGENAELKKETIQKRRK